MTSVKPTNPLTWNVSIVDKNGNPTPEFMRKWLQQQDVNSNIVALKTPADISAVLDIISKVRGAIIFRGAAVWTVLLPGLDGQVLITQGEGADPKWTDPASMIGFGFFAGGLLLPGELLGGGVFTTDVEFPGPTADDVVSIFAATATAVFNITSTDSTGIETVVGTLTFGAGTKVGTVVWSPSPFTLPTGSVIRLYGPTPQDATLAFISGAIAGGPG